MLSLCGMIDACRPCDSRAFLLYCDSVFVLLSFCSQTIKQAVGQTLHTFKRNLKTLYLAPATDGRMHLSQK